MHTAMVEREIQMNNINHVAYDVGTDQSTTNGTTHKEVNITRYFFVCFDG